MIDLETVPAVRFNKWVGALHDLIMIAPDAYWKKMAGHNVPSLTVILQRLLYLNNLSPLAVNKRTRGTSAATLWPRIAFAVSAPRI